MALKKPDQIDFVNMIPDVQRQVEKLRVQYANQAELIAAAEKKGMPLLASRLSVGQKRVRANLEAAEAVLAELRGPAA